MFDSRASSEVKTTFARAPSSLPTNSSFSSLSPTPDDEANNLATVQRSVECGSARARALELFEHFENVSDHVLTLAVAGFELQDRTLLQDWKRELSRGLRVLDRPHAAVLQECERQVLHGLCDRMLEHLRGYLQPPRHGRPT